MLSTNITVCIFAWNEAPRLRRCIDNFRDHVPMLVIDNESTDQTREVAAEERVPVVTVKNPGFIETPEVMDVVLAHCSTEYVLISSVSEYVPLTLLQLYADTANRGSYDVVRAYRQSITAGQPIAISGRPRSGDPGQIRFFRKGSISYKSNHVHGIGTPTVPDERVLSVVDQQTHHFFQFRDDDCSRTEQVLCRYDDLLARQRHADGSQFSFLLAFWRACLAFSHCYFRFGGFRFGMLGFLHSYYRFHMEFSVWLRLWEWENGLTLPEVKKRNDAVRTSLEAKDHHRARKLSHPSDTA
jgi:glycosyltransferase involved in cell wall biosynthesis